MNILNGVFENLEELGLDTELYLKTHERCRDMPALKILRVCERMGCTHPELFTVEKRDENARIRVDAILLEEDLEKIRIVYGEGWKTIEISVALDEEKEHQRQYKRVIEGVLKGCRSMEVLHIRFEAAKSKGRIEDLLFINGETDRGIFENLKRFSLSNIDAAEVRGLEGLKDEERTKTNTLMGEWSEEKQMWESRERSVSWKKSH